jgi:hypothetical protein
MENLASWLATAATIVAAVMTASNLGSRITGYGFVVFAVGSVAWLLAGYLTDQQPLIWTNAVLTLLNLFGVWRWLGRQKGLEEGGRAAQQESRHTPGEELFPASLLLRAKLVGRDGKELGRTVDAMVGCRSGRISYLIVTAGGVAGLGETLRRLDWGDVVASGEELYARLDCAAFNALPEIAKDDWPGR